MIPSAPLVRMLVAPAEGGGCLFEWPAVVVGLLCAVLLLMWFGRLNSPKSREEELEAAIEHGSQQQPRLAPEQPACNLAQ